jgi:hypothetical protein
VQLVAAWAAPLHQHDGEVGALQLRHEVLRHRDPLAGAGAHHHVVAWTVCQKSLGVWGGHERASAGRRPGAHGLTCGVDGPGREPRTCTPCVHRKRGERCARGHHGSRLRPSLHLIGSGAEDLSAPRARRGNKCRGWGDWGGEGEEWCGGWWCRWRTRQGGVDAVGPARLW